MQNQSQNRTQHERHLDEAIAAYLLASEAGVAPDQREWLSRYPHLAGDLKKFFADQNGVERVAGALRQAVKADHATGAEQDVRREQAADATHLAGGTVLGDFRIVREVGRGGMGTVYEAEQVSLGRRVALKVLPYMGIMDPRRLQRFRHEAQAAAQLHHTNIVPVFFVGGERGVHYYAMQFIDGRNLAELIRELQFAESGQTAADLAGGGDPTESVPAHGEPEPEKEELPGFLEPISTAAVARLNTLASNIGSTLHAQQQHFQTAAQMAVQAAEALDYAHQQGIIHRDVKPANLMLDAAGHLWVTDFGLARMQADSGMTMTGDLLGTLRYMSPEQALAKRIVVDHRTDIYSLGATIYELLTLQPALNGDDRQELLRQIAFEDPKPLRRVNRSIPVELDTIVLKAMAKNPLERYGTAQELADDLRRYLDHRPIYAKPPTLVERGRKWARRNRSLMVSLGISAVLLLVGLIVGVVGYGLAQRQLAKDQSDLADEREQARRETASELYHALLQQSSAVRLARKPGFRKVVWENLHRAASLDTPDTNVDDIRDEVLACLNDPIGLEPVENPTLTIAPLPITPKELLSFVPPNYLSAITEDAKWLAVAPQGHHSPAASQSQTIVKLHDAAGKEVAKAISPIGELFAMSFSPDGTLLVGAGEYGLVIWDAPALTSQAVFRGTTHSSVAIHPGGHLLACLSHVIELWTLSSNRLIATFPKPDGTTKLAFSADGDLLIALSAENRPIKGWPVAGTPEQRHLPGHRGGVPNIAFSPDSSRLATAGKDKVVRIWSVRTGALINTLIGHGDPVQSVVFSPDGSLLATGGRDGEVRIWDATSGKPLTPATHVLDNGMVWQLRFDRRGRMLVAGGRGGLVAWAVRTSAATISLEKIIELPDLPTLELTLHPAGSGIVVKSFRPSSIWYYDLARATVPQVLEPFADDFGGVQFHPSGRQLFYATKEGSVTLDWHNGPARASASGPLPKPFWLFALSADGRWGNGAWGPSYGRNGEIESGSGNFDVLNNRPMMPMPADPYIHWCVAISPDGTQLAHGLGDGRAVIWNLEEARARLGEFGIEVPSTAVQPESIPAVALPSDAEFEQMVELNRSREDQIRAGCRQLRRVEQELAVEREPRNASRRNDLSWALVMEAEPKLQDPTKAVEHSRQAVELAPLEGMYWNTLGAAEYRAGDWKKSIAALEKSMELSGGGDAHDWYFLAMAHWQLGQKAEALSYFDKAVAWNERANDKDLGRLKKEAAELLDVSETRPPAETPAQQ